MPNELRAHWSRHSLDRRGDVPCDNDWRLGPPHQRDPTQRLNFERASQHALDGVIHLSTQQAIGSRPLDQYERCDGIARARTRAFLRRSPRSRWSLCQCRCREPPGSRHSGSFRRWNQRANGTLRRSRSREWSALDSNALPRAAHEQKNDRQKRLLEVHREAPCCQSVAWARHSIRSPSRIAWFIPASNCSSATSGAVPMSVIACRRFLFISRLEGGERASWIYGDGDYAASEPGCSA